MKKVVLSGLTALCLFLLPVAAHPAPPVTVEILYMNHGPLQSTIKGIRELCAGYGKAVAVSWYDFESPEGAQFMAKKGVHQHVPLVIWIDGKPAVRASGKEIQFIGFPTGAGPPSFQGKWTLEDLRAALDQVTGKK
jgi:hypothetical protein